MNTFGAVERFLYSFNIISSEVLSVRLSQFCYTPLRGIGVLWL